ncbi:unnamed protein product [Brassica rapa subsp. trilocularis]
MSLCICKKQFFLFLIVLMLLIRGAVYSISVVFSDPDVASDSLAARSWFMQKSGEESGKRGRRGQEIGANKVIQKAREKS